MWSLLLVAICFCTSRARADLVAHWALDGDTLDAEGINDGIFFGGLEPLFVDDHDGAPEGAVWLDGIDDYIQIPPAAELALSDSFTLALWFRAESTDQSETYLLSRNDSIPGGSGKQYAIIYEYDDDCVDFYAPSRLHGPDPRAEGASRIPLADTEWHHIAYAYDGVTWAGYLDGEQVFATNIVFALDNTFASSWWIGAANLNANYVSGAIDDVRIYNHGLSAGEILELTGEENPCPEEGDTHATALDVEGPLLGEEGRPGIYTVTAEGVDDSGDAILFTFTARRVVGAPLVIGPQEDDFAQFDLGEGAWTISVTVDDDPLCPDEADDATLSTELVLQSAPALLAHWPLDGDLADEVGSNHGIFFGGDDPVFVDGHDDSAGGALSTDGIDDYVEIPPDPPLGLTARFTVAFWFRAETTGQVEKYLLSRNDGAGNQYAVIYGYLPDTVEFFGDGAFAGDDPRPGSGLLIPDTEWHHIAYAYDGAVFSGYLDGARLVENPLEFTLEEFDSSWYIGAAHPTANHVAGAFDDVRLYNYALSEDEIDAVIGGVIEPQETFVRGDPDSSGVINITDGIRILSYLFTGGLPLECADAGDTDDDGTLAITDAIKVFGFLFLGQGTPAAPAPAEGPDYGPGDCGLDTEASLGCETRAVKCGGTGP